MPPGPRGAPICWCSAARGLPRAAAALLDRGRLAVAIALYELGARSPVVARARRAARAALRRGPERRRASSTSAGWLSRRDAPDRTPAVGLAPAALHGAREARVSQAPEGGRHGAPRDLPADARRGLLVDARRVARLLRRDGLARVPDALARSRCSRTSTRRRRSECSRPCRPRALAGRRSRAARSGGRPLFFSCRASTGRSRSRPSGWTTPSRRRSPPTAWTWTPSARRSAATASFCGCRRPPDSAGRRCGCARRSSRSTSDGVWVRESPARRRRGAPGSVYGRARPRSAEGRLARLGRLRTSSARGSCSCRTGLRHVRLERGRATQVPTACVQVSSGAATVRYKADVRREPARGPGRSAIAPARRSGPRSASTPCEADRRIDEPRQIYRRIEDTSARDFVYTLDPPPAEGDPLVHFLLRSKAGHCEYFASAAAMMLAARGVPRATRDRLVRRRGGAVLRRRSWSARRTSTPGSRRTWTGPASRCWIPRPRPASLRRCRLSLLSRLVTLGREIEFFYDRRILGFDSGDQVGVVEAVRETFGDAAATLAGVRKRSARRDALLRQRSRRPRRVAVLGARAHVPPPPARGPPRRRAPISRCAGLLARRRGALSAAVPPAEVVRLFATRSRRPAEDAGAVVSVYCASAFGGRDAAGGRAGARERVRRLKKLA